MKMTSRLARPFRDLSLRRKIIGVIAVTCVLVASVSMLLSFAIELKVFRERFAEKHRTAARLLSRNLEVPFAFAAFADASEAKETIDSISTMPEVLQAVAVTSDGMVLARFRRAGVADLPDLGIDTAERFDWSALIIIEPVLVQGEIVGRVIIHAGLGEVRGFIITRMVTILVLLVLALGFAFWLASMMGSLLSQPILELAETAQQITRDQDFSRRHQRGSNDETGRLVDAFNAMMAEIENRQEMIRDSAERFKRYFELGVVGMGLLDAEMRWKEVNDRMSEILGYTGDELRKRPWRDLLEMDADEERSRALDSLRDGATDRNAGECWLRGNHGVKVYAMVSLRRVEATKAYPQHYFVLVQDITKRKEGEEDLRRAKDAAEASNRAKNEFLSIMSHELRTPLNPIIGFGQLLQDDLAETEHRQSIDVMMRSAQHLLELIDNILDYVRIERGAMVPSITFLDYRRVVDEAVAFHRPEAERRSLSLSVAHQRSRIEGEGVLVELAATPLRQLVLNLVGNALKFTHKGGVDVVTELQRSSQERGILRVEVRDTGLGIAPEQTENIFNPFTQLDDSLTRSHGGIGLGLAICRKIVDSFNGRIGVSSEPGLGSVFWFELPVRTMLPPDDDAPQAVAPAQPMIPAGSSVLLVEDDHNNRVVAKAVLRRCGVEVVSAQNGAEALRLLEEKSFELILMDVQMPEVDGFEATRMIRQREVGTASRIPIIGVTAHAGVKTEEACFEAGMDEFLAKPFRASELEQLVRRWIGENGRSALPEDDEGA